MNLLNWISERNALGLGIYAEKKHKHIRMEWNGTMEVEEKKVVSAIKIESSKISFHLETHFYLMQPLSLLCTIYGCCSSSTMVCVSVDLRNLFSFQFLLFSSLQLSLLFDHESIRLEKKSHLCNFHLPLHHHYFKLQIDLFDCIFDDIIISINAIEKMRENKWRKTHTQRERQKVLLLF